jgi:hypothetical protein
VAQFSVDGNSRETGSFSGEQILAVLKQVELGMAVADA